MNYRLQDLIDIEHFQSLQDRLNEIYSFPSSIIDNEGNILTATAWQDICTEFHRRNEECEKACIQSDRYILSHLHEADPAVSYRCPHGLVDNATPIIIDGIHYGNFFTGQFFLEPPDMEFFRAQAGRYGFDEENYLEAVRKVPVWTKEKLNSYLFFIKGLITVIAESGLKRLQEIEARKRVEESDERWQFALEGAGDGVWDWNALTNEVFFSRQWKTMLGFEGREIGGTLEEWDKRVHPEDKARVHAELNKHLSGETLVYTSEHRVQCKDGTYKWILDRGKVVSRAPDGKPLRVIGTHTDITERKQSEWALRESERKFRNIFDGSSDAIFIHDMQGHFLELNEVACKRLGYTREELLRMTLMDIVSPEAALLVPEHIRKTETRGQRAFEVAHRRKDRTEFPVEINSRGIEFDGKPCVLSIARDITERKETEEGLRRSQETARALAAENEIMAEIGRIVSSTLNVEEVYESFVKEAGKVLSFDRIVISLVDQEKDSVQHVHVAGDEIPGMEKGITRSLKDSVIAEMCLRQTPVLIQIERLDEVHQKPSSLCLTFGAGFRSFLNVPLFSKGGIFGALLFRSRRVHAYSENDVRLAERISSQIAGAIANAQTYAGRIRAESEKEKLQAQLLQAQKMESVGRLAGGVAHDFNNKLGVIMGNVEMAMMRVEPKDPIHGELDEALKAAHRSADLVRQLLAFARKQTVSPKVLDLNDAVSGMLRMLQRLIGEDIHLAWMPGKDLWRVKIDPSQVDQILANLAVNARDAIPDSGKVTVETGNVVFDEIYCADHPAFSPGEYVLLGVSDDGSGMSKEVLEHLFEPFFTTKELGRGTGLGLATVYGIVKQNDGFINVCSEPGEGTTFRIYLPRFGAEEVETEEPKAPPVEKGSETVLVVEDEAAILRIAKAMLESLGYRVLTAKSPKEAVQVAQGHSSAIDLLLTDVVMPEMNGRALAEEIRQLHPGLKCLYMSGYTADVIAQHGILDEGVNFVEKPFTLKDLAAKVRQSLNEK